MMAWDENIDIAIWGTGYCGLKMYYKYRHRYNIKCFIDNYPKEDSVNGISVIMPEEIQNIKIVIAIEKYEEICQQCENMGKSFFEDYLPYDFFEYTEINIIRLNKVVKERTKSVLFKLMHEKSIAIIIGNCQTEYIRKYMCQSKEFIEDYIFINIPMIHMISSKDESILRENRYIFERCDLCITQIISDDNEFSHFLSTSHVKRLLGNNTQIVKLPVLYFDIYFPQTIHQRKPLETLKKVGILSFPYGDCILDELSLRHSPEEIVEIVKFDNLFSRRFLKRFFEERIEKLREKESVCDIKILDYILANYKKELLFYSKNHPCNKLIVEFVKRILNYLGYMDFNAKPTLYKEMDLWQEIIYPSVAKEYGLQFEKEIYNDCALDEGCNFDEIVKFYLSYVHNKV